jgi:hypothetical protein
MLMAEPRTLASGLGSWTSGMSWRIVKACGSGPRGALRRGEGIPIRGTRAWRASNGVDPSSTPGEVGERGTDEVNLDADSLAAYMHRSWGLPLGTAQAVPAVPVETSPAEIMRLTLECGDLRLVRALPLWLSLVPKVDSAPREWPVDDRRKLAYLCELARALASLRGADMHAMGSSWATSVAGIEARAWPRKLPLCASPGPPVTPSLFGERWGIEEPMAFPEYVAFQKQYLFLSRNEGDDVPRAGAHGQGPAQAHPSLR